MVTPESYRLRGGDIAHVERHCSKPTKIFFHGKGSVSDYYCADNYIVPLLLLLCIYIFIY